MSKRILASKKMRKWRKEGRELRCSCGSTEDLTIDHVIPICILKDFGLTFEQMFEKDDWLQVMCRKCNTKKANHLDFKNPKTKEILMVLLKNVDNETKKQ